MADARGTKAVLKQLQARTGAGLNACSRALAAAAGDVHEALNALAAQGHAGGRAPWDPAAPPGCYAFDLYAARVVEEAVAALEAHLPRGGEAVALIELHAQEGIPVKLVTAFAPVRDGREKALASVDLDPDAGPIPEAPHSEDRLLEAFRYRFGFQRTRPDVGLFDEEPPLTWEISYLPDALHALELIEAAQAVARTLKARGFPVADGCRGAYARHDLRVSDPAAQRTAVARALAADLRDPAAREAFAALCYATPQARARLTSLAAGD